MKKLLIVALVALMALPAFAADKPAAAPAADEAKAPELVKLEGKVIVTKTEGQPDVVTFKTADAEYTLLPCDKLDELLKVADLADKTFEIEGEKVPAKDGKTEGFMLKNFVEKVAAPAEPAPAGN